VPSFSQSCPFCPGNEDQTTTERAVYADPVSGAWQVRVVDNKYPAVLREGGVNRRQEHPLALSVDGVGAHEVVIETPLHNRYFGLMDDGEAWTVVRAYRDRLVELSALPAVRQVIIFKNHGSSAGTSLEHPHSQIVATPVVPWHRRHEYEVAIRYFDTYGRNLYQDLVQFELQQGVRVVRETPLFVEIHPYASRRPFETWIVPRHPRSTMAALSDEELHEFSRVMRDALQVTSVSPITRGTSVSTRALQPWPDSRLAREFISIRAFLRALPATCVGLISRSRLWKERMHE